MGLFEEVQCKSLADFVEKILEHSDSSRVAFRGQACSSWKLDASYSRVFPDVQTKHKLLPEPASASARRDFYGSFFSFLDNVAVKMSLEFRQKLIGFKKLSAKLNVVHLSTLHNPALKIQEHGLDRILDTIILEYILDDSTNPTVIPALEQSKELQELLNLEDEFLSFAQHNGFSTPCLDWTSLPLLALWMAVEARPSALSRPTVFAVDLENLREELIRWSLSNFKERLPRMKEEFRLAYDEASESNRKSLLMKLRWNLTRSLMHEYLEFERIRIVKENYFENPRMYRQQGILLRLPVGLDLKSDEFKGLNSIGKEFVFPEDSQAELLRQLEYFGVTGETAFPGIEGIVKKHQAWQRYGGREIPGFTDQELEGSIAHKLTPPSTRTEP